MIAPLFGAASASNLSRTTVVLRAKRTILR